LFTAEETRDVLTVSELTTRVKRALETRVGLVWVEGEITNLRLQTSGHCYFTIKDESTQLSCVLFRGTRALQRELMEDGQKVVLHGDLTVYEPRGQYQLIVQKVELQGVGELQAKFEKLKLKLRAEGLFDPEAKRELPNYPQCMGIVTSLSGAALRDVLHVIRRRQPSLQIVLVASRVQGQGAEDEIAMGIQKLNRRSERQPLDLILITRGGGSLEDLWAFNEETLARAIFTSKIPVVSAVGHEIDFTISDFVADVRAATPSAAAEIITAGAVALRETLTDTGGRLGRLMNRRHKYLLDRLGTVSHRLLRCHPRRNLQVRMQRVDGLHDDLLHASRSLWKSGELCWRGLAERLLRVQPKLTLKRRSERLVQLTQRLQEHAIHRRENAIQGVARLADRLRLLGPENVLARGYSITQDALTGRVIRSPKGVKRGQSIHTRVVGGGIDSTVD
jgi:exodeoxyribonuclease VII large subunit